jgi:ribonuclease HIII
MSIETQAENQINIYRNKLKSHRINIDSLSKKEYNFEFTAFNKATKDKIKIQVYFGKKGLKTILQGRKESEFYCEVEGLIFDQAKLNFKSEEEKDFDNYIGSDETGKGDIFGPLIVCAFYCEEDDKDALLKAGVKDSKELSAYEIKEIALYLQSDFKNRFSLVTISPEKYNSLYNSFNNLNKLLNWAHTRAITNLVNDYKCINIIVDKFSNQEIRIEGAEKYDFNIVQTHKAERYLGVAAASIIARYNFDLWFKNQRAYKLTKGASVETSKIAKKIFDDYGIEELNKVAKLHFKSISNFI